MRSSIVARALSASAPDAAICVDASFAASRSTRAASNSRRYAATRSNISSGAGAENNDSLLNTTSIASKSSSRAADNRFTSSVSARVTALASLASATNRSFNRLFASCSLSRASARRSFARAIASLASIHRASRHARAARAHSSSPLRSSLAPPKTLSESSASSALVTA